jgi:hypothetical protein
MNHVPPDNVPPELWERFRHAERFEDLERGRLVSVVAIGQTVEDQDVRVELIALEVREAGAVLYWRAYPTEDRWLGDIRLDITDARGTEFLTLPMGGGGGGGQWSGTVGIVPAPPDPIGVKLTVRGFDSYMDYPPLPRTQIEGTWRFVVPGT